jgi:hypothetical protein
VTDVRAKLGRALFCAHQLRRAMPREQGVFDGRAHQDVDMGFDTGCDTQLQGVLIVVSAGLGKTCSKPATQAVQQSPAGAAKAEV